MQENLKGILAGVNDWLKYAEIKNNYLVVVSGVILFGTLSFIKDKQLGEIVFYYLVNVVVFDALALLTILISFLPQTKKQWFWTVKDKKKDDNVLYYGDICKYEVKEYLDLVYNTFGQKVATCNNIKKIEIDYADQIITNAIIAKRKNTYFRIAFYFTLSSIVTPLFGITLYWIFDPNVN